MTEIFPPRLSNAIAALRDQPIAATDKVFGILAARSEVTAAGLGHAHPLLFGGNFPTPVLALRASAVAHNIEAMAGYCAAAGVRLAPHGKTTMAPQLFAQQLAAGAWAITAATIAQVRVCRAFGVPRLLVANELTDRAAIGWLAAELAADPGFECYVYADSGEGIRLLDSVLSERSPGRPLPVLVELGYLGGRTGCRNIAEAVALAGVIRETASLRLAGTAGYEGGIGTDGRAESLAAVARFCRDLAELGAALQEGAPAGSELIVSAGGSAFFDVVARELTAGASSDQRTVILRSGVYVAFDNGWYDRTAPGRRGGPAFEPALELWAHVLSRPEPDLALVVAGRRDTSFDAGFPVPLRFHHRDGGETAATGAEVFRLDDQHAYLRLPPSAKLAPGDLVCLGISHPCTTLDKWRVIPVIDDGYRVIDAIHTFF